MSRGVIASGWATSTLSSKILIDSIGAVDEKFATTRTGDPTVLAVGETILIFCAPAMMDTKRNGRSVRLRANSKGKSSNIFLTLRAVPPDTSGNQVVDLPSDRSERAITLEFTIDRPQSERKNNKYIPR